MGIRMRGRNNDLGRRKIATETQVLANEDYNDEPKVPALPVFGRYVMMDWRSQPGFVPPPDLGDIVRRCIISGRKIFPCETFQSPAQ